MKKTIQHITLNFVVLITIYSCHSAGSSDNKNRYADSATIAKGEISFTRNCSSCHSFGQGGIGPSLGGVTDSLSDDHIRQFLSDPKKMIESGDERASGLFKKYKVAMPSFAQLADTEVNEIIAFLHTRKKHAIGLSDNYGPELSDPIPDSIQSGKLIVGLKLVTQIPASSAHGGLPLTRITKLDFERTSGNSFVLDLRGKLYKLVKNKPTVYLDLAKLKPAFVDEPGLGTGFGSFAFHPDFAKNGLLYTAHSELAGTAKADYGFSDTIHVALQYVLTEWKTNNPRAAVFEGSSRELLRVNMPHVMHGIQEIAFNPLAKPGGNDYGLLYICVGDGGSVEKGYSYLTHREDKIWGTILRIDPEGHNSANGQYGIPADNPFVHQPGNNLGEIYAIGFKNPHRITWTRSGQILVSNIGQANIESINLILPGHDYGWPFREGTFVLNPDGDLTKVYPLPKNDSIYHFTYPIAQYDHDGGWTAISGGFEYGGSAIPLLKGKFLFGDIASGRLFYIETADIKPGRQSVIKEWKFTINGVANTFRELTGDNSRSDIHFGRDARGELYILTKPDGKIYKLVNAKLF